MADPKSDPRRNAAIWYAPDGYDPENKGVNGRRVAGASFLKGFARHGEVDEFVSVSEGPRGAKMFAAAMDGFGAKAPARGVTQFNTRRMAPLETLYYPAPNYASELWRRQSLGAAAYSICGITHTTATSAVMQGLADLRAAPQMAWDALICTSEAVKASQLAQLEMVDSYLKQRFGAVPPRPQMPVIPLGINTDDYTADPKARANLRRRMGWKKDDIVVATLSRLTPYGKFDPFPLFLALETAQKKLGKKQRLHFLACGIYADQHSKKAFDDGAAALMPSVSFTLMDGKDAKARSETLSGADIFTFPIDNIQETFGLAPLEAMAAGLPVVTTDWDGMRDTVTDEVGIRVPTSGLAPRHSAGDAWSYLAKRTSYAQYGNNISAITEVDIAALAEAFATLARDPAKRRAMGSAGLERVTSLYDWSKIIPRYQELWGELSSIRRRNGKAQGGLVANPAAPVPTHLFASYPSTVQPEGVAPCVAAAKPPRPVEEMFELRQYNALKRPFETPKTVQTVLEHVAQAGKAGIDARQVAEALKWNPLTVERCYQWLLKYGYITRAGKGK